MVNIGVVTGAIILKDQFSGTFGKFGKSMGGAKKAMVGVVAGAAAVTAALGLAINKAFSFADALDNQVNATQASAESLQVFNAAAEQSGLSARNVTNAMQRMARNIVEGTKVATDGLDRLGISLVQIRKLKVEDQFRLIIRELGGIGNESEKTATAIALLGRAGAHFLGLTGDELDRFESELRDMNSIIDGETIAVVDLLEKEFDLLTRGIEASVIWIGSAAVKSTAFNTIVNLMKVGIGKLNEELSNPDGIQKWINEGINVAIDNVRIFALLVNQAVGTYARWAATLMDIPNQIKDAWNGADPLNQDRLIGILDVVDEKTAAFAETIQSTFTGAREKADEYVESQRTMISTSETLSEKVGAATARQERLNEMLQVFIQDTPEMGVVALDWSDVMTDVFEEVSEGFGIVVEGVGDMSDVTASAFERMGIKTRTELTKISEQADEDYQLVKESGLATFDALEEAHARMMKARTELEGETNKQTVLGFGEALETASGLLGAFAQQSKSIALATAIIDGIMAVQKAWASAPFPFNLPAVAVVTAATIGNVLAIRSSKSFSGGTPGLDFENFGTQSSAVLHGKEAVVPQGGGHQLAGEIIKGLKGQGGGGSGPIILELDGEVLARWMEKNTKSGRTRIHTSSVRDF